MAEEKGIPNDIYADIYKGMGLSSLRYELFNKFIQLGRTDLALTVLNKETDLVVMRRLLKDEIIGSYDLAPPPGFRGAEEK